MKLTTAVLLAVASAFAATSGLETIVKIDSGLVAGSGSTVRSYKGIPYAVPPAGDLRWKPPQPVKPWKGVRVAKSFPAMCPQFQFIPGPQSEDCLELNVWTTAKSGSEKLPVMVWIHGGGFIIGASSQSAYDGEPLATQGVVVVSINYRLGIFGFLAHPALSQESPQGISGNYGLLDMVAALQWVKRNIGAFGGDPNNVTIFGESAGGTAVCLLMVVPQAQGLFHKVIAESAWGMYAPISHLKESWYGRMPMEKFGETHGDLAALRSKTTADILKIVGLPDMAGDKAERGEAYVPVVDGVVLPDDPAKLFSTGKFAHVPLIAGTNADEGTLLGGPPVHNLAELRNFAQKMFGSQGEGMLVVYPASTDAEAYDAAAHASGDYWFLQGTRSVLRAVARENTKTLLTLGKVRVSSRQNKVFQYQFTRVNGIGRRIKWGCFHASEVPYVFGTLPDSVYGTTASMVGDFSVDADSYNMEDTRLSQAMSPAWVRFAKTGDPNGPGLTRWPVFTEDQERYLEFGDRIGAGTALRKKQLDFLTDFGATRQHGAVVTSTGGGKRL